LLGGGATAVVTVADAAAAAAAAATPPSIAGIRTTAPPPKTCGTSGWRTNPHARAGIGSDWGVIGGFGVGDSILGLGRVGMYLQDGRGRWWDWEVDDDKGEYKHFV
jgi:hypothetical protein